MQKEILPVVPTSMLFVTYGIAPSELFKISSLCRAVPISHRVIIDNGAATAATLAELPQTQVIPGDNSAFEFSGWQKGLESEKTSKQNPNLFLMTNDSVLTDRQSALPVCSQEVLNRVAAANAMAGRIRQLPCKVSHQGLDLSEYVQTHFFILPREVVERLGNVVSFRNVEEFIHLEFQENMFKPHKIWADGFDTYLFHMLSQRWHNRGMTYTPENYPFFKRKVHSILNELMLTARVRALGYPIMDLTPLPWLFNSFSLWNLPGRPIAPWQGIRNTIFRILDLIFFTRSARKTGLDQVFRGWCERSGKEVRSN